MKVTELKELSYMEASMLAELYVSKEKTDVITGIFFIREDCEACHHMIQKILPKVNVPDHFELFVVKVSDTSGVHFPPLRTPIAYFYIPNSPKVPIMREGVGPVEGVENDMVLMKEVMLGADYWETFFKGANLDELPEHEKK